MTVEYNTKNSPELQLDYKIPVAVLGATGTVGQKILLLLANHPWFQVIRLCASEQSAGKTYAEAAHWIQNEPIPEAYREMRVENCAAPPLVNTADTRVATAQGNSGTFPPGQACRIAFSALDANVAGPIEETWAQASVTVISNARNHRMRSDVPLIVPEVNPEHLAIVEAQPYPAPGCIITNPNCSTIGLVLALKPLQDAFGLDAVQVVTMQAISGAGYPGVSALDIMDNVIPYISGEEEKLEKEVIKILGKLKSGTGGNRASDPTDSSSIPGVDYAGFSVSASCHRVPVLDGHLESVSFKLKSKADPKTIIEAWENFSHDSLRSSLPLQRAPLRYLYEQERPQPRLDRGTGSGMTVSIGRLRPCSVLDWKFEVLVHNTIRGAAGGTVLLGELYAKEAGLIEGIAKLA